MMPSIFDMNRSAMQTLPHQSEQVGQQQMPELAQQPDPEEAKKKKAMMAQMLSQAGSAFAPQQDLELQQLQGVVSRPFEFQPPQMQYASMPVKRKMMGF
jgi:hypothetical protein